MRHKAALFLTLLSLFIAAAALARSTSSVHAQTSTAEPPLSTPDAACAKCHAGIYRRYERTPMARGSGLAPDGFIPGQFHHALSGVDYRLFERDGSVWMSFNRPASAAGISDPRGALSGERRLSYFLGSGHRGRTFLYTMDGLWFELPINYYTKQSLWDMTPNYGSVTRMPAPLPVETNCLHCHATGISPIADGTRNRFVSAPFSQGGIGCSACHGDATQHLATAGKAPVINPDKLTPARRDSVCTQCHLEGDTVIFRPNRNLAQFHPGDDLAATAVYFVRSSQSTGGARATSQYEALLRSACKRAAGDKLTCTTCHDPHDSPTPANRVAYFRARCLSCHNAPALAATHHPEQPNCASCHMPSSSTTDISHEQVTDHDIEAHPPQQPHAQPHAHTPLLAPGGTLLPVGNVTAGDRELGLAYAQFAQRGDRASGERALTLLTRAEQAGANDEQLHLNLGFLDQVSGNLDAARAEYEAALMQNPSALAALTNLAVLKARTGDVPSAMDLLTRTIHLDPTQTSAGLDLAFLECKLGHADQARTTAEHLLPLNPDNAALRAFLADGSYGADRCPEVAQPSAR